MDLAHNFLLAMPGLTGDYFADSLTYICEHNDDGAMGIIVNRPSEVSLIEMFSQLGLALSNFAGAAYAGFLMNRILRGTDSRLHERSALRDYAADLQAVVARFQGRGGGS